MTTRAPLDSFEPRRRRQTRVAAAASICAVIFGVSIGGPSNAAAYSVQTQSDGDVVVAVRHLKDAEGLERALRARGLDATVTYDPDLFEERGEDVCDFEPESPIIGEKVGSEYLFTIPANSPLQDRPFGIITTHGSGDEVPFMAWFESNEGYTCVLTQTR